MASRQHARAVRAVLAEKLRDEPDFAGAGLYELGNGQFAVCVTFFSEDHVLDLPATVQNVPVMTQVIGEATTG